MNAQIAFWKARALKAEGELAVLKPTTPAPLFLCPVCYAVHAAVEPPESGTIEGVDPFLQTK